MIICLFFVYILFIFCIFRQYIYNSVKTFQKFKVEVLYIKKKWFCCLHILQVNASKVSQKNNIQRLTINEKKKKKVIKGIIQHGKLVMRCGWSTHWYIFLNANFCFVNQMQVIELFNLIFNYYLFHILRFRDRINMLVFFVIIEFIHYCYFDMFLDDNDWRRQMNNYFSINNILIGCNFFYNSHLNHLTNYEKFNQNFFLRLICDQ